MDQSSPEHYPIADFLKWKQEDSILLNPQFQRGSVWTPAARTYLIDTILRGYPIPKILMRTSIDRASHRIFREVVDGQQRLQSIIDFGNDKLILGSRAGKFSGMTYSTLPEELQMRFLAYKITGEQLINATDEDVLEVFARINSYSVPVIEPELRNAAYDTDFKWSVYNKVREWHAFWDLGVLSPRDRVRMHDQSLMAEMYGVIMRGVTDGGQPKITRLYKAMTSFPEQTEVEEKVDSVLDALTREILPSLKGEPLCKAPHALMIFAAVANALHGIPQGELEEGDNIRQPQALSRMDVVVENLLFLNEIFKTDEPPARWQRFWRDSKTTTHRIASRKVRFRAFSEALLPSHIGG
ncbi:DUF262 domain-containing protein [Streptomyces collinus]|uniref:DUF262 domain-containing protein n=1 Tax=Streptomyces collinus TaxID=42684 RepID=UPI0036E54507